MRELIKKSLFLGSGLFYTSEYVFNKLRGTSGVQITIPFYHLVSDDDLPHLKHIISYRDCSQFREDISFFSSHYTIIGIPELLGYVEGNRRLPPNPLLITFDDGLREFYENAMPILEEYNAPAVVFINSGFVDNKKMFYRHKASLLVEKISHLSDHATLKQVSSRLGLDANSSLPVVVQKILDINYLEKDVLDDLAQELGVDFDKYLLSRKPYLSYEDIKDLLARGFFVGAHSIDHPEYDLLPLEEQVDQTTRSMRTLLEKENLSYRIFASPFHDTGLSMKYYDEILGKAVDLSFGIDGTLLDPVSRNFQRFNMEGEGNYPARRMLSAYYFVMIVLKMLGKQRIQRT